MQYQDLYVEWTPDRVIGWAKQIGPCVAAAVTTIMESKAHPEQGFRSCLGVIRLERTWGNDRVNTACQRAISLNACSYKYIKLILESGGDQLPATKQVSLSIVHDNVRGPKYYSQSMEGEEDANTSNDRKLAAPETDWNDTSVGIANANARGDRTSI
jgi:hypothetical protein